MPGNETELKPVDYEGSGVKYAGFDDFKCDCLRAGISTAANLKRLGFEEVEWSRGESVLLMKGPRGDYFAHVVEGLGTKFIPADAMAEAVAKCKIATEVEALLGRSFFKEIAQCNVAMNVNDLITLGAKPMSFLLHVAVESDDWFANKTRRQDLIEGTRIACDMAQLDWGGGETPVLRKTVVPGAVLLSGSATGYVESECQLINPAKIENGDMILLFGSSGPHSNGYTMLWNVIAPRLPHGYLTRLPVPNGPTFGEAILTPTTIYARLIERCINKGVRIHYAVNITGHGWCKLMRSLGDFVYVIDKLPPQQPLFDFIQKWNPIGVKKMYKTFNMGAGFAIYVPRNQVQRVVQIVAQFSQAGLPYNVTIAGHIEKSARRGVVIKPANVEFGPEDMEIR